MQTDLPESVGYPDLPFLAFLEKSMENHPKKARTFLYAEPLKSLGKKGNNAQKGEEIPCDEKSKEIRKSKERKIRVP